MKAQVDYVTLYLQMYIAYNAWYCEATGTSNNRQAIGMLKKRVVIWDDYLNGKTLQSLKPYLQRLSELTQHQSLGKTQYWDGSITHASDWRSLIEFWYQVRCLLVHGSHVSPKLVWLAYETLDVFMGEIVARMHRYLTESASVNTFSNLGDGTSTGGASSAAVSDLQRRLQYKYLIAPDLWAVDMRRV